MGGFYQSNQGWSINMRAWMAALLFKFSRPAVHSPLSSREDAARGGRIASAFAWPSPQLLQARIQQMRIGDAVRHILLSSVHAERAPTWSIRAGQVVSLLCVHADVAAVVVVAVVSDWPASPPLAMCGAGDQRSP
jgi:hypothetical protein